MSIDERARHELHRAVEQALGADEAASLMALLPPVGWADVATKSDFETQRAVFTAEMDGLRTGLRADMSDLRSDLRLEMSELRSELRGEMTELRGEVAGIRGELTGVFEARLADTTRTILLAMIGLMIATWAAIAGMGAVVLTR